jgi:F420-non-reducing hydrogenase large subunit
LFLNDEGTIDRAYLQIPELRGFEKFCEGRPVEELPRITPRICGVCPGAHHMASSKAVDAVYGAELTPTARKLRDTFYHAHMIHSHIAHFFVLAAPDLILGPDAPVADRNILGLIQEVGLDVGKAVISARSAAQRIQAIIGGRPTHPVFGLPGGVSKQLSREELDEIREGAEEMRGFMDVALKLFMDQWESREDLRELISSEAYYHESYYMGMVDENDNVEFYDGEMRVVDKDGNEAFRFRGDGYLDHIEEHVEPWSYLKFPYLKEYEWQGITGDMAGMYQVGPLARLNAAEGMATPAAEEARQALFDTIGGKPAHHILANHWARIVEMMQSAEELIELTSDDALLGDDLKGERQTPSEGVGIVEAPRGTLIHHYWTDENGFVEKANLVVATVHNNLAMNDSIRRAAEGVFETGQEEITEGMLNRVEMAFRAYDPCFACATHSLPGRAPIEVVLRDADGNVLKSRKRRE